MPVLLGAGPNRSLVPIKCLPIAVDGRSTASPAASRATWATKELLFGPGHSCFNLWDQCLSVGTANITIDLWLRPIPVSIRYTGPRNDSTPTVSCTPTDDLMDCVMLSIGGLDRDPGAYCEDSTPVECSCTTASVVLIGSGARPALSRFAVRQAALRLQAVIRRGATNSPVTVTPRRLHHFPNISN
jgi:hypothetical protein